MQLTMEADYALRIVYVLAERGQRMEAKSIAETSGVALRFALKILRKMVGAGIIKSFKGSAGGYVLAGPPDGISMLQVIEAVEGPIRLNRCTTGDFICTRQKAKPCAFRMHFSRITEELRGSLDKVTIDMIL